jgi:phosphonate transport system substrate-binding protein
VTLADATRRFGAPGLFARGLVTGIVAMVALGLAGCGERVRAPRTGGPSEIVFSILSAQGQATAAPLWQPLLDDLSRAVGVPVRPHFSASYSGPIDELKRGVAQVAWLSAQPAIEAVDTAGSEVVARTVNQDGQDSYRSTLVVRRGSGLTLAAVLECKKTLNIGLGDAHSTSGTLVPAAFLFNPRNIRPETCFRTTRAANHERNAVEVASGILDVATSNTATLKALQRQNPLLAADIETIWESPPIPEGGIVVRSDLDPVLKEKIRGFFLGYGRGRDAAADRERRVLAALDYSRFVAADEDYLDPVRELVSDQALTVAREKGDAAAAATAERELRRLRAKREVQP